jgi:translation initiation factor 2 subunit 2
MSYEDHLERAFERISERVEKSRFEIPSAVVRKEGNKTILQNFKEVCDVLNRSPQHLLRYLIRLMGTKGKIDGSRAILTGVFGEEVVQKGISSYTRENVLCSECNRPDTRLIKEGKIYYLECDACGARYVPKNV